MTKSGYPRLWRGWTRKWLESKRTETMQTKMRLARFGAKKKPFYRIVVAAITAARNGRFIDQIGSYDPTLGIEKAKFNKEKVALWLGRGTQPTDIVRQILKKGIGEKVAGAPASLK